MSTDMTNVEVILTLSYPLPADLALRAEIYGATDPAECVRLDIDNDPYAVMMEADIVNVEVNQ